MEKKDLAELITIPRSSEGRAKLAELKIVHSLVGLLQRFVENFLELDDSQTSDPSCSSSQKEILDSLLLLNSISSVGAFTVRVLAAMNGNTTVQWASSPL
ncbi:unnamed protein product [Calypogeia fissa]